MTDLHRYTWARFVYNVKEGLVQGLVSGIIIMAFYKAGLFHV